MRIRLTAIIVLCWGVGLGAYALNGTKWAAAEVPYYVNPTNRDGVSHSAVIAAIQAAAGVWSSQSRASVQLVYIGTTSASAPSRNGVSEVVFKNATDINKNIAIAKRYSDGHGTTLEFDITFFDAAYRFFGSNMTCVEGHYIQDIATHEFGHVLGLAHSSVSGATMVAGAQRCATWKRSLHADDIAGIEFLYPPMPADPDGTGGVEDPEGPTLEVVRWWTNSEGEWRVALEWSGLDGERITLYRNGTIWGTTPNDGGNNFNLKSTSAGPWTFMACDAITCTPPVTEEAHKIQ